MKSIKELLGLSEEAKAKKMKGDDPCWDSHEMVGMKKGKGGKPVPNCVPKNEEVEIAEAKVGDTVSFHHELQSAPGTKVKKSGTVEKVEGGVVHVKVKDKYGVKRHQVKMGDLVKEDTELEEASDTKRPPNFTMHPIDRQDYKILRKPKKTPPKDSKEWGRDAGEKKIKEEVDQIDELNKDTVYSYNKKADAYVEKKHKSLGQLMRKGDAAGANKASHQINRRLAGMERAEKRLNKEEVEVEESKKNPASDKPVDPKDLVVSLKDVPVKKPRGHKQYDPSKEFPGVKALKREETELGESTKLLAKHGDVEVHSMGSSVLSVLKKGKEIAQGDYDRHADAYWISHPSFGKGDKAFDTTMDVAKHFSSMKENFANDFLAMAKNRNPNARIVTADQKKKEAEELMKKRAETKPTHAAPTGNSRSLGGYDPKSGRSYSEEVETAAQVTKHFEKGQSTPSGVPKWVAEPLKKKKKVEEAGDPELMGGAVSKPTASGNNPKLADKFMKAFRKMKSPANISCKTVGMISTCEDVALEEAKKKKDSNESDPKQMVKSGEKLSGKQEPVTIGPELQRKGVA